MVEREREKGRERERERERERGFFTSILRDLPFKEYFILHVQLVRFCHFNVSLIVWAKSQDSVHKPQFLRPGRHLLRFKYVCKRDMKALDVNRWEKFETTGAY